MKSCKMADEILWKFDVYKSKANHADQIVHMLMK